VTAGQWDGLLPSYGIQVPDWKCQTTVNRRKESTMNIGHGQGKKLGFIAQEIGREINTLGSKSNHAEMQQIVVQMKDELEQIKEQVLNVL
jgi:uncharacterized protein (TIGR00255 family)